MFKSQKRDSCLPLFVRCPWDRDHQISHSAFYDTPSLSFWHLLLNCNLLQKKSLYSTALQEMAISISCVWALRNMGNGRSRWSQQKLLAKREREFSVISAFTRRIVPKSWSGFTTFSQLLLLRALKENMNGRCFVEAISCSRKKSSCKKCPRRFFSRKPSSMSWHANFVGH